MSDVTFKHLVHPSETSYALYYTIARLEEVMYRTSAFKAKAFGPSLLNSRVGWTKTKRLARLKSSPAATTVTRHDTTNEPPLEIRDIPGPSMFENISTLFARQGFRYHHLFMQEMFDRYGPIFRHSFPGAHIVYVSDPVDIEHVYRSQEKHNPYRGDLLISDYSVSIGMERGIAGDDESWHRQRRLIGPKVLPLGVLKPYFDEIMNVADDTIAEFKEGRNDDLKDYLTKWAAESVGVILFGLRMGTNYKSMSERATRFINAVNGYFDAEAKLILGIPFHKYFKTPTLRKAFGHFDTQMEIVQEIVTETRKECTELAKHSIAMQLLDDDKIGEEEMTQICNSFFIGGVHTTGNSALHCINSLSKFPDVQQKAYEEIKQSVGTSPNAPTYVQLSSMPYLRALIKESLRYSIAPPANLRVTKVPVTVRGYHIPPGTKVVFSAIASKETEKKKYGDPENFAPERWLRSAKSKVHPFSSLPFGFGKRSCIAKRLVNMEISVLLLRLLQHYEILENKSANDQVDWIFQVMVTPDKPYPFYLKKRQ